MDNDTPNPGPEESEVPSISWGNPDDPPDVHIHMDDTYLHTDDSPPFHADDTPPRQEYGEPWGSSFIDSPPPPPPLIGDQPDAIPPTTTIVPVSSRIAATPPPRKRTGLAYVAISFAAAVVGALLTVGVLSTTGVFDSEPLIPPTVAITTSTVLNQPTIELPPSAPVLVDPAAVAKMVLPSVVTVNVYTDGPSTAPDGRLLTGSGSGVVSSSDGYIITNHHVVANATSYTVTFEDGRRYEAQLIGSDALTDLAVLQVSADDLTPIRFGSSETLNLGDPAIAVGNPLAQQGGSSISVGIISAFNRQVNFADQTTLFRMIQTDAAINSGSSGGALVDASGKLIGITSAIGVSTAGPEGIGYAIPVELVERITSEIIDIGHVEHPFIGVTIQTHYAEMADGAIIPAGATVETIEPSGSAAGDAGIQTGDVIVEIDGTTIASQLDLINAVRLHRVGDVVTFTIMRDGVSHDFDVTMGQRPTQFQG